MPKIEMVDVAVIVVALGMLAEYIHLGNAAFLFVFAALMIPEIFFQLKGAKIKISEGKKISRAFPDF